jgi:Co/Zn/Cd efflux system component
VLVINAAMFVVELAFGLQGRSTGLIADSLDMLADAGVYALSLLAVGRSLSHQRRAAVLSGRLQIALAVWVLLVRRHREGGVHMRASVIFSTNDTLANLGVIVVGLLVLHGGRRILLEARAARL